MTTTQERAPRMWTLRYLNTHTCLYICIYAISGFRFAEWCCLQLLIMCFLTQAELTFCAGDIIAVFGDIDEDGFYYVSFNSLRCNVLSPQHYFTPWLYSFRVSSTGIEAWFHPIFSKKCLMMWRSIWRTLHPTTVRTSQIRPRRRGQRPNGYIIAVLNARPRVHSSSVWVFGPLAVSVFFLVLVCFFFLLCDRGGGGGGFQSNLSCSRKERSKAH